MKKAYTLLGIAFIVVFGGAYLLVQRVEAPESHTIFPDANNVEKNIEEEINNNENTKETMSLSLTSLAFKNGETIPKEYTCDGGNMNPPLSIGNVPVGTKSFVLVMDDRDIPKEIKEARGIEKFNHWAVYNLPADIKEVTAGAAVGSAGVNSRGDSSYTGPCPPPEYQPTTHRYSYRLYAVSGTLNFIKAPTLDEVEIAAKGMMLDSAELVGIYDRSK